MNGRGLDARCGTMNALLRYAVSSYPSGRPEMPLTRKLP